MRYVGGWRWLTGGAGDDRLVAAGEPEFELRGVDALASVALFAILRHMISHGQAPDAPRPVVANMTWTSYGMMLGFGLSIPVFFATAYGWLLWIIIPILVARLRRLQQGAEP
jgi:hypothetical protein